MNFTLGLDVHKQTTAYALVTEEGRVQERGEIKTDPKQCLDVISWIPKSQLVIGMESTTFIYPLYDALNDAGYKVKVANPVKLHRITKSAVKYDGKDAKDIALQLLRNDFPQSYMLTKEMRDKRELIRQHMTLTQEQTRVKNRIHSHIAKHNYRLAKRLGTKASFEYLKKIELPKYARVTLDLMVDQLQRIKKNLKDIDKVIDDFAHSNEDTKKLLNIDGVGVFTAATFYLELGNWRRFRSAKQLTAYVALIPQMSGSANKMYYGRMRFDGNHNLKYAICRAAEQAIRKDNKYRAFFLRLMKKGKRRRTAICAVGNKLLRSCYGVLRAEDPIYSGS
ncbi:MAG: IS110 family transposase [Bacteroidota bacterium]|nr:IS110 family transposase [Bacteroidota bacterium]